MVHEGFTAANGSAGLSPRAWITQPRVAISGLAPQAGAGPLAGLRFAVKDNIDVAGLPTTAACPAYAYTPAAHATVVQRLLDAGASLVGKTNLDQFACGLNGTRSPYGAVPNAVNADYVSGGSSSGSAYVVATGQVDFALGTDTAGSGRVPAGLNGIVGLKPSRGLISARGVVPAAQSVDCVSIFARSVGLAARVLAAAQAHDAADPYSRRLTLDRRPFPQKPRIGVPAALEFFGDSLAEAAWQGALEQLRALGADVVPVDWKPLAQAAALLYESALVAERYAAVREFFDAHEAEVIEPVRSIIGQGRQYSAADYVQAQVQLRALGQVADAMWGRIDALVVPTAPTHYTIAQMQAEPVVLNRNLGHYTNFVNLLDYAAVAVPAGLRSDALPFGVTFIGPCASDWRLAQWGARFLGEHWSAPPTQADTKTVRVAVVGAHLSGMPLNSQLTERGATLAHTAFTTPDYRLFALAGTSPPKPGLLRVAAGEGRAIALELWDMPIEHYGSFVALVPAPLSIGTLALEGGGSVQGFLCEALATQGARDISSFGGWRAFLSAA